MKTLKILVLFFLALVVASFAPAKKVTEVIKDYVYIDDVGFDVPCGNNGLGMHITGTYYEHIVNQYDADGHWIRGHYTLQGSVCEGRYDGVVVENFTCTGAGKWESEDIFDSNLPVRIVETDVFIGDQGTKIVMRPFFEDGVYKIKIVNCF